MKKYIITIIIAVSFIATPALVQAESIFPQIVNLLIEVNISLRKQNDLLKKQIVDLQTVNTFLDSRLQICSINRPATKSEPKLEVRQDEKPKDRTTHLVCPNGNCYQVTDQYHY